MHWVEEHPYLSGSLVLGLIVVFFVVRGVSSSSGGGTQVVQSGPSDSLQAAQLSASAAVQNSNNAANVAITNANAALAAKQIDANTSVQQSYFDQQTRLQAIYSAQAVSQHNDDTSLAIVQAQVGGQTQLASIGAASNEKIAGIQADVTKYGYDSSLKNQAEIDAATIAAAQIASNTSITNTKTQYGAAVDINQSNNDTSIGLANISAGINRDTIQGNLDYTKLYNAGQSDLANISAGVQNNYIIAQHDLYSQDLANQAQANNNAYEYKTSIADGILSFLKGGGFNKGGEGGSNQVSISNVLLGGNGYAPPTQPSGFNFGISIPGIGSVGAGASL